MQNIEKRFTATNGFQFYKFNMERSTIMNEVVEKAEKAREITFTLAGMATEKKNAALQKIANRLWEKRHHILQKNSEDVTNAKENGQSSAIIDRLTLTEKRLAGMVDAIRLLMKLEDPVGNVLSETTRPNGLQIKKVAVPLGVIAMIYEARPNVTIDAAALSIKTGNAILLRGSTSTIHSNKAIVLVIQEALAEAGLPEKTVQLIENPDRAVLSSLYTMKNLIDVLIPRGGKKLIETVVENARIPVLETGAGNCHVYIDESADKTMAVSIVVNAKTQRPSVCNACETVLIHENWAKKHLPALVKELKTSNVTLRGDHVAQQLAPEIGQATEQDWADEFLDLTLAVKIVPNIHEALDHIEIYGTKHSEAIISETKENVALFFNKIDASTVYHNASTRFTDGFEFGFGAEIGISTQKLHVRGPMGLEALTTTKYHVYGEGQTK
ncbi:glutamate-5-semialdehyde dehydrogenase [Bacillus sp. A301a_S52]|nr:glutamate-5-semialdehyde dehydrogenase [Bacillus sp. A301a_S52]